jgi:hypothetical protein
MSGTGPRTRYGPRDGGAVWGAVPRVSSGASRRRPPSRKQRGSRARREPSAWWSSFRSVCAGGSLRLPPGAGCEEKRGEAGAAHDEVPPVHRPHLRTHPITSFRVQSDDALRPSPHASADRSHPCSTSADVFGAPRVKGSSPNRLGRTGGLRQICRSGTFRTRTRRRPRRSPGARSGVSTECVPPQEGRQPAPTAIAKAARLASAYMIFRMV